MKHVLTDKDIAKCTTGKKIDSDNNEVAYYMKLDFKKPINTRSGDTVIATFTYKID